MPLLWVAADPPGVKPRLVGDRAGSYDAAVQLTRYTDYALRTMMYLGLHADRAVPVPEIAAAYRISPHHVAKVAQALVRGGFVRAQRGRAGGLALAAPAAATSVGTLVRHTEPGFDLLECFDRATSTCPLTGACRLERTLHEARAAFLDVLDRATLADLLQGTPALATRLVPRGVPERRREARAARGRRTARARNR